MSAPPADKVKSKLWPNFFLLNILWTAWRRVVGLCKIKENGVIKLSKKIKVYKIENLTTHVFLM